MALISCPICTEEISEQAPTCPHCGHPIAKPPGGKQSPPVIIQNRTASGAGVGLLLILLILGGIIAGVTRPSESALRNALIEKYGLVYGIGVVAERIGFVETRYHDYLVFSSLSIQVGVEPERVVAFGLFGKVFVPDAVPSLRPTQPFTPRSASNSTNSATSPLKPETPPATPQNTIQVVQNCVVNNGTGGMVKLRRHCDTKNCEQDPSTMYTEAANGAPLGLLNLNNYSSGRFTWRPVSYNGEVVWISATKLSCSP